MSTTVNSAFVDPVINEGLPVDESIARSSDPLWLHQNGMWEFITPEDDGEFRF